MRVALARLGAAYMLAAAVFGGLAMTGARSIADVPRANAAIRGWYERLQLRMNPPPTSLTIAISPWTPKLRRIDPDAPRPLVPPYAPNRPREIVPQKPSSPLITRFADDEPATLRDMPAPAALAEVETPKFPDRIASLAPPEPVTIDLGEMSIPAGMVARRLRSRLSRDLYTHFDLFLYVSKSVDGPLSQHMYVFAKRDVEGKGKKSNLVLLHDWPISTGRETLEIDARGVRSSTTTPVGYYQLDPKRFYRRYTSAQWRKPMPNSMFFDWMVKGYRTGLAIHGVSDPEEVAALGTRFSAGCVHLAPDDASALFEMIQSEYKGMVPRFAYNSDIKTISNDGRLAHNRTGGLSMVEGYKALVVIENYGGQDLLTQLEMDKGKPEG